MATKPLNVLYWNVENLFHPETGGPREDQREADGWTMTHYNNKLKKLAETIQKISADYTTPAIIGLSEVENLRVGEDLGKLLPDCLELMQTAPYSEYHDSILYFDNRQFAAIEGEYFTVLNRHPKGDIQYVKLLHKESQQELTVYLIHFKSRYEGTAYTDAFRCVLSDNLQARIFKADPENKEAVLIAGDFNDEPFSPALLNYLKATYDAEAVLHVNKEDESLLYNCSFAALNSQPPGTLHYPSNRPSPWMLFDQIIVSRALLTGKNPLCLVRNSYQILHQYTADSEGIPDRCFRWQDDARLLTDGYSDHFPVMVTLECK